MQIYKIIFKYSNYLTYFFNVRPKFYAYFFNNTTQSALYGI